MTKLLIGTWDDLFVKELTSCSKCIRIISPFISIDAIGLLTPALNNGVSVRLITRLNDRDFLADVSSIDALLAFNLNGGEICGQSRSLHSKIYVFDDTRGVVTSSNLTTAGLQRNSEIGVYVDTPALVNELVEHFEKLWKELSPEFEQGCLEEISKHVAKLKLETSGGRKEPPGIIDHGKSIIIPKKEARGGKGTSESGKRASPPKKSLSRKQKSWVKFAWRRASPAKPNEAVHTYGDTSCAITFPEKPGRPNEIKTGDRVYHAALTNGSRGRDWIVYGRGTIASAHRKGIDELPSETREKYPEAGRYPFLAWLSNVDLIGKDLRYGVSLYELFDELKDDTFLWSQNQANNGKPGRHIESIRYHRSHIELTQEATELLDAKLEHAFEKSGKVHRESGDDVWWNGVITDKSLKFHKRTD